MVVSSRPLQPPFFRRRLLIVAAIKKTLLSNGRSLTHARVLCPPYFLSESTRPWPSVDLCLRSMHVRVAPLQSAAFSVLFSRHLFTASFFPRFSCLRVKSKSGKNKLKKSVNGGGEGKGLILFQSLPLSVSPWKRCLYTQRQAQRAALSIPRR